MTYIFNFRQFGLKTKIIPPIVQYFIYIDNILVYNLERDVK